MKSLVNPVFCFLILQCLCLVRLQKRDIGRGHFLVRALLLLTVFLAIGSTPLAVRAIEYSLSVSSIPESVISPDLPPEEFEQRMLEKSKTVCNQQLNSGDKVSS